MLKIQRTKEFQTRLSFQSHGELFSAFRQRFLSSDLGKIYQAIPWEELVKSFALQEHRKGPQCYFSPQGKIALMFLKSYAGYSDQKLLEQLILICVQNNCFMLCLFRFIFTKNTRNSPAITAFFNFINTKNTSH